MAQRLLETLSASLDFIQSGQQIGAAADDRGHLSRVGDCLACEEPVANHWDASNRFCGCVHAQMLARRSARMLREVIRVVRGEASGERGPR